MSSNGLWLVTYNLRPLLSSEYYILAHDIVREHSMTNTVYLILKMMHIYCENVCKMTFDQRYLSAILTSLRLALRDLNAWIGF